MSKGKRYEEPKLNIKKVIAVILAIIVIIMSIFAIKGILSKEETGRITSLSYFPVYDDNKWGVIDSNGNIVIDPSYQEMIIIPNNKNDMFLCTYDVDYNTGEYKTKALNSKNEEIFTEYQKIEAIQNKDENNNLWYEDNNLRIQKDGKYGMISFTGKELLKPEYEEITALDGIKNTVVIHKDGKVGIADSEGRIILDPIYLEVNNLGKDNKSGYIVKDETTGKYGIVDYSKNQVLEPKYDSIEKVYNNDLYVVTENGTKKVVNKSGEDVLTSGFEEISEILKAHNAGVIFKLSGKYGVMAIDGTVKIQPEFDNLKEGKSGYLIATKEGKTGIIDTTGAEKVEYKYQTINYNELADMYITEDENFNSDILNSNFEVKQSGIFITIDQEKGYFKMRQQDEYKYYNFKFEEKNITSILPSNTLYLSKKDGKYGFVDKDGKVVVDYIYDDATEQNLYGFAGIKKDGKWGSINSKGNIVIEPTYNLDEYLLIDFIGKWHLGQDTNMNYYNKK